MAEPSSDPLGLPTPSIGRFYETTARYDLASSFARRRSEIAQHGATAEVLDVVGVAFPSGAIPAALEVGGEYATTLAVTRERYQVAQAISCDLVVPRQRVEGIEYRVGSAETVDTSFEPASFDLVLLIDVIEHLYDTDRALEGIRTVLRPEGALVVVTPNLSSWLNRLMLLFGWLPLDLEVSTRSIFGRPSPPGLPPAGHIRVFTRRALLEFLRYHGFEVLAARSSPLGRSEPTYVAATGPVPTPTGSGPRRLGRLFRWVVRVDGWVSRAFPDLGSRLIILARPTREQPR